MYQLGKERLSRVLFPSFSFRLSTKCSRPISQSVTPPPFFFSHAQTFYGPDHCFDEVNVCLAVFPKLQYILLPLSLCRSLLSSLLLLVGDTRCSSFVDVSFATMNCTSIFFSHPSPRQFVKHKATPPESIF